MLVEELLDIMDSFMDQAPLRQSTKWNGVAPLLTEEAACGRRSLKAILESLCSQSPSVCNLPRFLCLASPMRTERLDRCPRGHFQAHIELQPCAVPLLQLLRGAQTLDLPRCLYGDPRAQGVCFLHRVRGQDHGTTLAALRNRLDHVPHEAASDWVHARRRLVQEDNRRLSNHRDRTRQLPHVAATELGGPGVLELAQVEGADLVLDVPLQLGPREALDLAVEFQVLTNRKEVKQSIELGTITDHLADAIQVLRHVFSADKYSACARLQLATHHLESGGLPCAVDAEESKHLAGLDCKSNAPDREVRAIVRLVDVIDDKHLRGRIQALHARPLVCHGLIVLLPKLLRAPDAAPEGPTEEASLTVAVRQDQQHREEDRAEGEHEDVVPSKCERGHATHAFHAIFCTEDEAREWVHANILRHTMCHRKLLETTAKANTWKEQPCGPQQHPPDHASLREDD
mmetsp:Transcript_102699/g.275816  ORF Transcript_102699/g.275816 Transcript_102699/m.275816 type:complete len:458 (-) Transcript_102699:653-2026(-)